jgi:hypothetical protein
MWPETPLSPVGGAALSCQPAATAAGGEPEGARPWRRYMECGAGKAKGKIPA